MTTALVVAFLLVHGLVHFAVWLPHPDPGPGESAPFAPDHSAVLTMTSVPQTTARKLSTTLAVAAGVGFVLTGLAVAVDVAWAVPVAVVGQSARPRAQGAVLQPLGAHRDRTRPRRPGRRTHLALDMSEPAPIATAIRHGLGLSDRQWIFRWTA